MANPIFIYPVIVLVLTAIAIYVQVSSSNMSLPISLGTTVLTILLPFFALANVYYTPLLHRLSRRDAAPALLQLLPSALQIFQGVLVVVLATLSFEGMLPGDKRDCNLQTTWKRLWMNHDGRSIERIQDAYNCCGLNSVKHMSWPQQGNANLCSQMYHRSSSCVVPWRLAMQRNDGLSFGVAVAVGILQLVNLTLFRLKKSNGMSRRGYKRITPRAGVAPSEEALLEDAAEDHPETAVADGDGASRPRHLGYGASGHTANPRLQPSGLGNDTNQWSS